MSDRRAEAFAVMDKRETHARRFLTMVPEGAAHTIAYLVTLRSVLERHSGVGGDRCPDCGWMAPCPTAQTVIDALLGEETND